MARIMVLVASLAGLFAVTSLAAAAPGMEAGAEEPARLRPPAVPLVTHDPYFSIWSAADRLTDVDTTHWTGKPQPICGLVRIDGRVFRILGAEPRDVPALPQKFSASPVVTPTRTTAEFANEELSVVLSFMTPALPGDLDLLARPVTYVSWGVHCRDGKEHSVQVYFDVSAELTVNTIEQAVVWDRPKIEGLVAVRMGSKDQAVLAQKGDDLRIDWGRVYLADGGVGVARAAIGMRADVRGSFVRGGTLPENDDARSGCSVRPYFPTMALTFDLGNVDQWGPGFAFAMLAYDDEWSVKYFRRQLRPYWRRGAEDAASALRAARRDVVAVFDRCQDFDRRLLDDLCEVGGEKYALLCALAYRQAWAGNKIAADANGEPLVFPKECFSNGCIATVDVLFPQAPFFLTFSPKLTKGMLVPILDYASSALWPYGYAPHDLGTYPHATGQVYGMDGGDGGRMPVEESGNMLIMLAALAKIEGNAEFAGKYWPLLTKWADYLVANGLDPENQLCSADMFGHLPHCANLALKAIIGIGGCAQMCTMLGKDADGRKYMAIARDYAAKWCRMAADEGRTRLAYHLPGTWGMKHNLVWQDVLGLDLIPQAVVDAEIAWYLKVQKKYGLPVDNRTETSLIDWAVWSIAPARNKTDFEALVEPLFKYAHETPSRVPLSDWFVTTTGAQQGFQARPVVGGVFVRMLANPEVRARWAQPSPRTFGWAPFPATGTLTEVVPTARKGPVKWRYTFSRPTGDWFKPEFDASAWKEGEAGFGTKGTPGAVVRTEWATSDIWLRREFELPEGALKNPVFCLHYDEAPEIYINGVLALKLSGWSTGYETAELSAEAKAALKPGKNVMAVRAHQTYGGQYIDVGIAEESAVKQ